MKINSDTHLTELLAAYPFLRERLPEINEAFSMLQSPFAKIMIKKATVSEMSRRSGMEEAALIRSLEGLIAKYAARSAV